MLESLNGLLEMLSLRFPGPPLLLMEQITLAVDLFI